MKTCFLFIISLLLYHFAAAQKYALIDLTLSEPIRLTDAVTQTDISNRLFPVEKRELKHFIHALSVIKEQLYQNKPEAGVLNFRLGCVSITGNKIIIQGETRFCYNLSFLCDNIQANYLLCDCKLKNSVNSFIVNVWIKYLKKNMAALHLK